MTAIFFWNSVLEIWIWIVALLSFFFHPVQMAIVWLYIFHLAKGALGLLMAFVFAPTSYDMIDSISDFDNKDAHLSFEEIGNHINTGFKKYLGNQLSKKKLWLAGYLALTIINAFFDWVGFIWLLVMFGQPGHEFADIFMLFVTMVFMAGDKVYLLWGLTTFMKLPPNLRKSFLKTFGGFVGTLRSKLSKKTGRDTDNRT
jgi:hypothetical protein